MAESRTETTSQQTDDFYGVSRRTVCYKIWSCIWPIIVAGIFVGLALGFAIIYTGFGTARHKESGVGSDSPAYCIRRVNDEVTLNRSNIKLTSAEVYPYVGSLVSRNPFVFLCAVVILNVRYVLTGANCFTTNFDNLSVKVGSDFWDRGNEYDVEEFIIHGYYNGSSLSDNLALIRVDKNIILSRDIQVTKLSRMDGLDKMKNGVVVGWTLWASSEHEHVHLVEQELIIWEQSHCEEYMKNSSSFKFICASLNNSICNLDVTGPLIANGKLIGFWSWGLSCLEVPSIFTNLYWYKEWISKAKTITNS